MRAVTKRRKLQGLDTKDFLATSRESKIHEIMYIMGLKNMSYQEMVAKINYLIEQKRIQDEQIFRYI